MSGQVSRVLYEPLAPWQIRLIRIHPSENFSTAVVCDLVLANLIAFPGVGLAKEGQIVQYEAVSYSWGYPTLSKTVQCNGVDFPVSEAAFDAIRHMREASTARYIWIDCCCINQADLVEKSQQVRIMFTVFQKAIRVLAWTGMPVSMEEELLFRVVNATAPEKVIDNAAQKELDMQGVAFVPDLTVDNAINEVSSACGLAIDQTRSYIDAAAQSFFTSKQLFRRTWIRQEFLAARELRFICGSYTFNFSLLNKVLDRIRRREIMNPPPKPSQFQDRASLRYKFFRSDLRASRDGEKAANAVWFETILLGTIYEASLPQDKIYAILGMIKALTAPGDASGSSSESVRDITRDFPLIDYTKSVSEVYQEFVKHTINIDDWLGCLMMFEDRSKRGQDLPSWAIDLRVDVPRYTVSRTTLHWRMNAYVRLEKQDFNKLGKLDLKGRKITTVAATTESTQCWKDDFFDTPDGENLDVPTLVPCLDKPEYYSGKSRRGGSCGQCLREMIDVLHTQCGYKWVKLGSVDDLVKLFIDWRSMYQFPPTSQSDARLVYYAFVSGPVAVGDYIVHLNRSELPAVVRQVSEGWKFLGPAILAVGCLEEATLISSNSVDKASIQDARASRWVVKRVDYRDELGDRMETFVLV